MNGKEGVVTITGNAASRLRDIAARENRQAVSLRIAAVRTRCMGGRGYTYSLAFEDSPAANDELSEHNGIKVYVDPASAAYLKGAELDYIETLAETGFKINNPNVVAKCPCGHHDIFE
ncbi:MAG: iron-sulfur cluster assembly accessory protein [Betaproteobacteria bacterium]|nr:iron-sulfur cluster assembly accessory protein [Betaproteobacteria bacterium]